jgi:hypothetical protein
MVTDPWIHKGEDSNEDDRRLLHDDSGGAEPPVRNDDGVFDIVRIVSIAMCTSSSI